MQTKFTGAPEITEAAKLICEDAVQKNISLMFIKLGGRIIRPPERRLYGYFFICQISFRCLDCHIRHTADLHITFPVRVAMIIREKKHLNINLKKDVFRCPRCGFCGGVFDLYSHYTGIPRNEVRDALIARLNVQGEVKKPRQQIVVKEVPDCPLTDVDSRHETYQTLLSKLSLASGSSAEFTR